MVDKPDAPKSELTAAIPRQRRIFRVFEAGNAETLERVLNDDCVGWEIMEVLSNNNPDTSPYLVVCHTSVFGMGGLESATTEEEMMCPKCGKSSWSVVDSESLCLYCINDQKAKETKEDQDGKDEEAASTASTGLEQFKKGVEVLTGSAPAGPPTERQKDLGSKEQRRGKVARSRTRKKDS